MAYTNGIRKIVSSEHIGFYGTLEQLCEKATSIGAFAVAHNGCIYIRVAGETWHRTCFDLEDFEIYK